VRTPLPRSTASHMAFVTRSTRPKRTRKTGTSPSAARARSLASRALATSGQRLAGQLEEVLAQRAQALHHMEGKGRQQRRQWDSRLPTAARSHRRQWIGTDQLCPRSQKAAARVGSRGRMRRVGLRSVPNLGMGSHPQDRYRNRWNCTSVESTRWVSPHPISESH